jgi:hypothetical protein
VNRLHVIDSVAGRETRPNRHHASPSFTVQQRPVKKITGKIFARKFAPLDALRGSVKSLLLGAIRRILACMRLPINIRHRRMTTVSSRLGTAAGRVDRDA